MTELRPTRPTEPFAFAARDGQDWGASACEYAHFSRQIGFYAKITDALLQLAPHPLAQIVDFGCGDGRFTRALLGQNKSADPLTTVYLVDKFTEMLALTNDVEACFPNVSFVRVQDADELSNLATALNGTVDLFACNSSFHLLRDVRGFAERALRLIRAGGYFVANIPDQDFNFADGWSSEFSRHANRLMPSPARQAIPPKFSAEMLNALARSLGSHLEIEMMFFPVTWADFVAFYSIPFMGARRLPALIQEQRVRHLADIPAAFDVIQYRWAFLRLTNST